MAWGVQQLRTDSLNPASPGERATMDLYTVHSKSVARGIGFTKGRSKTGIRFHPLEGWCCYTAYSGEVGRIAGVLTLRRNADDPRVVLELTSDAAVRPVLGPVSVLLVGEPDRPCGLVVAERGCVFEVGDVLIHVPDEGDPVAVPQEDRGWYLAALRGEWTAV